MDRYHRQILLPQIGAAGQNRLARASVLLVGCGALGTTIAEQLARAGVGRLAVVDRDIVELTNLQRQTLFTESDVRDQLPKAIAAERRLRAINGAIRIDGHIADVSPENVESLVRDCEATLLLDGTDNVETRYLLNDVAIKHDLPWVYGGCVGTEGRVMPIIPGRTPCLRCLFPKPPGAGEVATCDTAGVLGPAASVIASLQAAAAIRLIVEQQPSHHLLTADVWTMRFRSIDVTDARRSECRACGERRFEFLDRTTSSAVSLCGRNSVQVRTHVSANFSLSAVETKLRGRFELQSTPYFLKGKFEEGIDLTLFVDGRVLVHGTADPVRARTIVARYLG